MPTIALLLLLATPALADAPPLQIAGETSYKPHELVKLRAGGVPAKAGLRWRVSPSRGVQRATTARHLLEFAAPPGTYEVELLVIRMGKDGEIQLDEARTTITIESCHPPTPPRPTPPEGKGKLDPPNAIGRIQFGSAGCSATVIGPRRPDGRWDVLTAAHCVNRVGQRGTMRMPGGQTFPVQVVVHQPGPDLCWLVTDEPIADLAHANLAPANPPPGTAIWHQGYGVDQPRNREEGVVVERENGSGQLRMILSVSSGDSGGGIFRADTNELVSAVCCTAHKGLRTSMWGGSVEAARRLRPRVSSDEWTPHDVPTRPE